MHEKMDVVNEETKDDTMEDMIIKSSSTTPMQTSAHLAAKLKKLMQADMTHTPPTEVTMEIDTEDQKKQVQVTTHWPAQLWP